MDSRKSKYIKYSDNDYTSKSKPNRSKNKSKQQPPIDKINSANSQNTYDYQNTNSNSSSKSLMDKKKLLQNKKSNNSSTTQKRHIPPKESISRQTNPKSQASSSILLGFPDGNISAEEDNDPYTTKIGGKPNWLLESHPLSHDVIICKNCDKDMFLLFQGYVPLEDSIYDRVIYIFGCNQQRCINKNGSFRAFRAHRKDEKYERYQQESANKYRSSGNSNDSSVQSSNNINRGDMLFGVIDFDDMQISEKVASGKEEVARDENGEKEQDNHEDDEWPELSINNKMSSTTTWQSSWSRVISDAEKARNKKDQVKNKVSNKRNNNNDDNISQIAVDMSMLTLKTNWPKNIKSFPAQYLYITEEVLEEKNDVAAKYLSYEEIQDLSQENEDNFDWFGEKYEKSILPKGYDKTFKKFSDRVAEWPDQCVRYQFDGQPLLYTHNDVAAKLLLQKVDNCNDKITSSKLPFCHWCGSKRVFELQLMPSMLTTLSTSSYIDENEVNSNKKNDNLTFNLGMEWGTIMIFTCKDDCEKIGVRFNEVSYYEEVVMVQYEQ